MEYIKDADYGYIMNKYHATRFSRRDDVFDAATGMDGDAIEEGIVRQDREIAHLPHPVRKARAFAYVLENTRISCDPRDLFPNINMVDRPLNRTIVAAWKTEVFRDLIPDVNEKLSYYNGNGIATIWPDFDHSVPDWDLVFRLGFRGILENSERARAAKPEQSEAQTAFYDGILITWQAILAFLARLEDQAQREGNDPMRKALSSLRQNPPQTFYEALLMDYIYFMLSEHIEGLQVRSLANFDRIFYPFYRRDLENGVSEAELRRQLAYFFLQFTAIGNYWNQPVFLGGCKADESTEINDLSYVFLDVYDKMGIYNPKVQLKIADSTPPAFIRRALDMIRRGNNSLVFVSDATIRRALENAGCSSDEARLCNVKGCYEYSPQGSLGCGMNYVNLLKPLEYAMHRGCDGVTGKFAGLTSPEPDAYESFEELFDEYCRQLARVVDGVIDTVNGFEGYLSYINPQSMLSATYTNCLKTGKDALCGGAARNNSNMMFGFMADIADSLTAIKKVVFDQKLLTLSEFADILDRDFEGQEKLRLRLLADRDKYGNNRETPDAIAQRIAEFLTGCVCGKPNAAARGGSWNMGFHVARQSYDQAPKTLASPNGRRRGEELSKNLSPSMGMNREGATAAILSITKIDATAFTSDACLDLGLLPSAVKGEDGLDAMYALLMTFIKRGGHAMHINVFDAETLRAAQREPEKYRDLQIRVCGWNVLFHNINRAEQDGFIRQAEALV
ncbi:MAG: hypothetical protein E7463_04930 [Ruminococcaceae bacterium]|nr:hypothetical protein [Oscillospiraceae bacterium]